MTVLRRLPLIPTMLVAAAVVAMIALGVWQIDRAGQKTDLIALYRANLAKPAMSFPDLGPVPRDAMFRPSSVTCRRKASPRSRASSMSGAIASGSRLSAILLPKPQNRCGRHAQRNMISWHHLIFCKTCWPNARF